MSKSSKIATEALELFGQEHWDERPPVLDDEQVRAISVHFSSQNMSNFSGFFTSPDNEQSLRQMLRTRHRRLLDTRSDILVGPNIVDEHYIPNGFGLWCVLIEPAEKNSSSTLIAPFVSRWSS